MTRLTDRLEFFLADPKRDILRRPGRLGVGGDAIKGLSDSPNVVRIFSAMDLAAQRLKEEQGRQNQLPILPGDPRILAKAQALLAVPQRGEGETVIREGLKFLIEALQVWTRERQAQEEQAREEQRVDRERLAEMVNVLDANNAPRPNSEGEN